MYEYAPKGLIWIDSFGLRYIKTKLPPKVIVEADEVTIEHYYSNNYLQIHAHVKDGGYETKISSNGHHPIKGYLDLTPKQRSVVKK